jgi:hypothetical protein
LVFGVQGARDGSWRKVNCFLDWNTISGYCQQWISSTNVGVHSPYFRRHGIKGMNLLVYISYIGFLDLATGNSMFNYS